MTIFLDTETTGLNNGIQLDEVVQIGIVDAECKTLLNTLVKPTLATPTDEALAVCGITREALETAPAFADIAPELTRILTDASLVLIYNAPFDVRVLMNSYWAAGLLMPVFEYQCVMQAYATAYGQPHETHGTRSQKLVSALEQQGLPLLSAHDALADAQMTASLWGALHSDSPITKWGDAYGIELVSITRKVDRYGKAYASFTSAGGLTVNVFADSNPHAALAQNGYPVNAWLAKLSAQPDGTPQPLSKPIKARVKPNDKGFIDLIEVLSVYEPAAVTIA